MGIGVQGADVSVAPESLHSLSTSMQSTKESFDAALDAIDAEVRAMAGNAMGEDSPEYQAFLNSYDSIMKPKAEEISAQLESHSQKAETTANSGAEMIRNNVNTFNNFM